MSSFPSSSSLEFIRSVLSLTNESPTPDFDTLLNPVDDTKVDDTLLNSSQSGEATSQELLDVDTGDDYTPWCIFVNYVDKFNGKHIGNFLSHKEYGSLKPPENNLEGETENVNDVLYDSVFSLYTSNNVSEELKHNYTVIGSVMDNTNQIDEDVICLVDHTNKNNLFERLKYCGFIVYDISRYPDQIEEARWVLNKLLKELKNLDSDPSDSENHVLPSFILISTYMTWVLTKPVDPDEPTLPFQEMDYKSRQYHPNFKMHFEFENEVVAAGKVYPEKFKTLVICAGLPYGFEEDTLNFLFRMAWENEPALPLFGDGGNCIPLVHIADLAMMLFTVLEIFPRKLKYLLAVEQNVSSMKSITKAISGGLTSGDMMKLHEEDMISYDVSQHVYDCLTVNVRMEPAYFAELEQMLWRYDSFVDSIINIIQEYRFCHNLHSKRILVLGPPASGKTTLARKLCEYYEVHYISKKRIGEIIVEKLKEKIARLTAKQEAAVQKDIEKKIEQELRKEDRARGEEIEEEELLDDEPVEYIREGREEAVETLCAKLDELTQIMESNEGVLDNDHLFQYGREILSSSEIKNQGFVLDGFPENVAQAQTLFQYHDFNTEDDEDNRCVDYVFVLQASFKFIIDRVLSLSEEEIQEKGYDEDRLTKRIMEYQVENSNEFGLVRFLTDHGIQMMIIPVEEDKSVMLQATFEEVLNTIGEPSNFEMTMEEKEEERKANEEAKRWADAQELARKQEVERQMYIERLKKLEDWAMTMDSLREEEEEILAASSGHIRHYLDKYIFPTLTQGLLEVARLRPEDPVDFLAEYLFRNNADGKMLIPDDTHQYRKLFKTINKNINAKRKVVKKVEKEKKEVAMIESGDDGIVEKEEEINILDLQVGERPAQTFY